MVKLIHWGFKHCLFCRSEKYWVVSKTELQKYWIKVKQVNLIVSFLLIEEEWRMLEYRKLLVI